MSLYESYYKLFEQERTPVWTGISLLATIAIEGAILIAADSLSHASFGATGIALSTVLLVILGVLINIVAGYGAHKRGEVWGGRIAALGIVTWIATLATVYHHYH